MKVLPLTSAKILGKILPKKKPHDQKPIIIQPVSLPYPIEVALVFGFWGKKGFGNGDHLSVLSSCRCSSSREAALAMVH